MAGSSLVFDDDALEAVTLGPGFSPVDAPVFTVTPPS